MNRPPIVSPGRWGRIWRAGLMVCLVAGALFDLAGAAFRLGQKVQSHAAERAGAVGPALLARDMGAVQLLFSSPPPAGVTSVVLLDGQGRVIAATPPGPPSGSILAADGSVFVAPGRGESPVGDPVRPIGRVVVLPAWGELGPRAGLWILVLGLAAFAVAGYGRSEGGDLARSDSNDADFEELPQGEPAVEALPSPESQVTALDKPPVEVASSCPQGPVDQNPLPQACSPLLLGIAEETRAALGVVASMVELLDGSALEDRQRRYLGQLRQAAGSLDRLAAEVMDLAAGNGGSGVPRIIPFSPEALAEAAVVQAHQREGESQRDWAIQVDPSLPRRVEGDASRIQAAIAKVVEHALRTYPRGDACLRVRPGPDRPGKGAAISWHIHIRPGFAQAPGDDGAPGDGTLQRGVGWRLAETLVWQAQGEWEETPLQPDEVGVGFCVPVVVLAMAPPLPNLAPSAVAVLTAHAYLAESLALFMARLGRLVVGFDRIEALREALESDTKASGTVFLDDGFARDADLIAILRAAGARVIALVPRGGSAPEFAARAAGVTGVLGKPVLFGEISASLAQSIDPPPAQPVPMVRTAIPAVAGEASGGRILVVEDHALNREIVLAMLARLGRVAVAAGDGYDAVDRCARESFDLVLMDIQMPGLDGLAATRAIRRAEQATGRKAVPIVALTANVLEDDRPAALAAGMNDYLAKPITALRLHGVLERWIASPANEGSAASAVLEVETLKALPGVGGNFASPQAARYVGLFLRETTGQLETLVAAADRGDLEAVRAGCHRMKSAAAGVGAADVARRARALEAAIKSGSATADVREDLEKIRAALQCYHDAVIAAGVALPEAARACQDPP
ncbi:MAG: response regulator [Zoogloeaceae bacterium]|nr:response regulator [Zoogloeaceae bacterium]